MRLRFLVALLLPLCACQRGSKETPEAGESRAGDEPQSERAQAQVATATTDAGVASNLVGIPEALPAQPAPGNARPAAWLDGAERLAIARTRGGAVRVVAAGTGWLRLFTAKGERVAQADGIGAAHLLEVIDVDGDGIGEIVVGRGLGRSARDAPASLTVHWLNRFASPEEIALPASSRAQLIATVADPQRPGRLYVGAFTAKYEVVVLRAERSRTGVWRTEQVARTRMAWGLAAGDFDGDGQTELASARLYGDGRDEPGDVQLLETAPGAAPLRLPSVRGARSVTTAPGATGGVDLIYSDGWHRKYRRHALALVTRARRTDRGWQTELLANVSGSYSYDRLRVGDLDGDGAREVIAAGNGPAVRIPLDAPAPDRVQALGSWEAFDARPVDLDGDGAAEVVLVGPSADGAEQARGWIWRTVGP